ncbi:MAG: 4Fe-4S binding protein [Candidatus Omnitrophica bacterium]|nr:4Fe-4S binding protein [Candidatus Omnitrophota bacterium]
MIILKIKKDRCKGCQLCIEACPQKKLKLSSELNRHGTYYAMAEDAKNCIGCGLCFVVCPDACIEIYEK